MSADSSSETLSTKGKVKLHSKKTAMKLFILIAIIASAAVASGFALFWLNIRTYGVAIASSPSGSGFITVDGNPITTPCNFTWLSGSKHNVTANARTSISGVQYVYSSWSDGQAQSHTITVNDTANYNATFVAVIPLTYNYVPGEQMTYNTTNQKTISSGPFLTSVYNAGNITIGIVSFDGENYTMNETMAYTAITVYSKAGEVLETINQTFQPADVSLPFEVNKAGYLLNVSPASFYLMQTFNPSIPSFVYAFDRNETEAGTTFQNQLNGSFLDFVHVWVYGGNLNETFGDVQNLTVPAGTYRVFRVTISGSNFTLYANYLASENMPSSEKYVSENITITGQEYLEYGTNRMIEMNVQMHIPMLVNGQASEYDTNEEFELVKYVGS